MKKILRLAGGILTIILVVVGLAVAYICIFLPNTGPSQDLKVAITPEKVARGEYLANHVCACMDCHSRRDFGKFSGPPKADEPLGGGGDAFTKAMGFPGTFYAKNITPYHLDDWTDGEIFRAITTGVNKSGKALFPVMPYEDYGKMSVDDITSIIAYLRTLQPVKRDVPVSNADFPVNVLVHTMPKPAHPQPAPDKNNVSAYGKYLTAAAGCMDCHTKFEHGKFTGTVLAGGREFNMADGTLRSPNLTPDAHTGIGSWSEAQFVGRFKIYADSAEKNIPVGPHDFNTPMAWTMYAGMDSSDLSAIYTYLHTLTPTQNVVEKFTAKR